MNTIQIQLVLKMYYTAHRKQDYIHTMPVHYITDTIHIWR